MNEEEKVENKIEPVEETKTPVEEIKVDDKQTTVVSDQAVVQNISDTDASVKDETPVQNVVDNSVVEVTEEPKVEEVKVKEEVTYKDPSKLSTFLVILLFVGLGVFIFEMPKINQWLDDKKQENELSEIEKRAKEIEAANKQKEEARKKAEEEARKKAEEEENATITLSCRLSTPATDTVTYAKTVTETFDYNKKTNKVISSTLTTKYTFTAQDANYTSLKTKCETDANKYLGKDGYGVSCTSDDLSITSGSEFDLANYKTITDGATTITPNATLNEDITAVKTRLTAKGYICE